MSMIHLYYNETCILNDILHLYDINQYKMNNFNKNNFDKIIKIILVMYFF